METPLRGRLMVGRLTLDQVVKVRILAPQLYKALLTRGFRVLGGQRSSKWATDWATGHGEPVLYDHIPGQELGMTVEEAWDFFEGWRLERPDVIERVGRTWWGITDEVLRRDAPAITLLPEHDPRPRCLNCFEVLPEAAKRSRDRSRSFGRRSKRLKRPAIPSRTSGAGRSTSTTHRLDGLIRSGWTELSRIADGLR